MLDKLMQTNVFKYLDNLIILVGYCLVVLGVWLIFSENIIFIFKYKSRKIKGQVRKKTNQGILDELRKHLRKILYIVYNSRSLSMYYTFIIISLMLLAVTFIVVKRQATFTFTIFFSICSSLLPYLYLRLKLRNIRVEGSHEAEGLITELINQYKINYFNMVEAIDKAIPFLNECPHTQKMLFRLSSRIKEYKTDEELQAVLEEFTYSLETQWGIMLANNLYLSISDGMVVAASLEDILLDLRDTKNDSEISKRLNNEGFTMVKLLSPLLYIASVYASIKYFGFTLSKFIDHQLNTPLGFKFFMYIVFISIVNFTVVLYFKKQKFDF